MVLSAKKYVYKNIDEVPAKTAVLVLGAMTHGTTLSHVLHDRVSNGIRLLENGTAQKILLSGDHGKQYYDEVNAMKLFVINNAPHIAKENVFLDHAGFSTWDSVYRARDVFEVNNLIIVTQDFHIARAICMARRLGIDAVGYSLNQNNFSKGTVYSWYFREYFARIKAFLYIIFKPKPRFLGDKIPITGNGQLSWD